MSRQNFIEQFRLFMELARKSGIPSREIALWMGLFHLANEAAIYDERTQTYDWPDGFFKVAYADLTAYGRMDKRTLLKLRERLKQRGLIDYVKGNRKAASPGYRLRYLRRIGNRIVPIGDDCGGDSGGPNGGDFGGDCSGVSSYCPKTKPGETPGVTPFEEEDEEDDDRYGPARAAIERAWLNGFGKPANPLILDELARRSAAMGFEPEIAARAVYYAAMRDADSPADYALKLMADWHKNRVRTMDDLDEYTALYDMAHDRRMPSAEAEARLRAFREDRETPDERRRRLEAERRESAAQAEREAMIRQNSRDRRQAEYLRKRQALDREYGENGG